MDLRDLSDFIYILKKKTGLFAVKITIDCYIRIGFSNN